ncbi:MAG: amidohydrolase [Candidatus Latescibacteria bacterium]|nr:amidohydrolase [Candidatus Latescibacterota bacterium]
MKKNFIIGTVLLGVPLVISFITSCSSAIQPADLVLRNGKIATVNESFDFAEAVAVRGDTIIAVGDDTEIEKYIGPDTKTIDLDGKLVVPGLIDAHAHMLGYGTSLTELDFRGTTSFSQIVDMVAEKAKKTRPGEWITGSSWDQNDWENVKLPSHETLSQAVPDKPVWLTRVDGHAAIANRKALEIAGITNQTKNPEGGEIIRDSSGKATGVFVDNAMFLVSQYIPDPSSEQIREALAQAARKCCAAGLTEVHDAGVSPTIIEHYKYLIDNNELVIRINAMLHPPGSDDIAGYMKDHKLVGYGNNFLTVRSMKLFMDGALGSSGAALFKPYSDRPGYSGLLTTTYEQVLQISRAALETGFQVCTHAIGDRGNRLVLDAYEQALKERPTNDHRFRIEHAQVVTLEDIPRFAALGILPSMQPTHATSDMYWAEDRVGPERIKGAYAWQKFLRNGCIIPCGSDFPVEEINPMLGFYAAITRKDPKGWPEGGWYPEECMTREQVLRGFTIWAAYAAFQENILGSIEPGKLADMVVLSKDILTVAPEEILSTVPLYTIIGGKIQYSRD